MIFNKQFNEKMIDETLLNSYCERVEYNITKGEEKNTTFFAVEIISNDEQVDFSEYNQMCMMKFFELFLQIQNITAQNKSYAFYKNIVPYDMLIISLGLLSNCLSICVFFGTKLRYSSPSVYLGALAISDNCYLMVIAAYFIGLKYPKNWYWKFHLVLQNVCSCWSAWLVIFFTVERYIAIKWPLRHKMCCIVARAKTIIFISTILLTLVNIPFLWKLSSILAIYKLVQVVILLIIPLIVIVIFNILITYNIYKNCRDRKNMTVNSIISNENSNENWMSQAKILLVPCAFICTNMPACVMSLMFFSLYINDDADITENTVDGIVQNITTDNILRNININDVTIIAITSLSSIRRMKRICQFYLWNRIAEHIYLINFSINFLLYCMSGKTFRDEVVGIFKKSVKHLENFYKQVCNKVRSKSGMFF